MIRPVLLVMCAAGAMLSARDAALAWRRGEALATLARGEPVRTGGQWLDADPQLSLIAANAAVQLNPAANPPGAEAAARASLARDPFDPAALYVLAVMGERRRPGTALPIFQLIEDLFATSVAEVQQEISAALVAPAQAEGFKVKPGSAVLEVRRTYKMTDGKIGQITINTHPAARFRHSMTMRRVKA